MTASDRTLPPLSKQDLRKQLLQQRQALSPTEWRAKSDAICHHLAQAQSYQDAKVVAAYLSTRQEPDLSALWHPPAHIQVRPKRWGLPRCVGKELLWHECSPAQPEHLQTGPYSIQEPLPSLQLLTPEAIDLILVPAVACDDRGFRVGYGGGFYDRLLSRMEWANTPTIGIVFDFAYLAQVPADPWDYPVQAVCTEQGLFSVSG